MKSKKSAFSLVDVGIAICTIALIASFVVPVWKGKNDRLRYEQSVEALNTVSEAMEKHYLETGTYPVFEDYAEITAPANPLVANEYIDEVPATDAWGREYFGSCDGKEYEIHGFSITSHNEKIVAKYNDYSFRTGNKFKMKGKK